MAQNSHFWACFRPLLDPFLRLIWRAKRGQNGVILEPKTGHSGPSIYTVWSPYRMSHFEPIWPIRSPKVVRFWPFLSTYKQAKSSTFSSMSGHPNPAQISRPQIPPSVLRNIVYQLRAYRGDVRPRLSLCTQGCVRDI